MIPHSSFSERDMSDFEPPYTHNMRASLRRDVCDLFSVASELIK